MDNKKHTFKIWHKMDRQLDHIYIVTNSFYIDICEALKLGAYQTYRTDLYKNNRGTRWRNEFRHYATIRKVAGSIPGGVIEIFPCHNPSDRTMTLGLNQPLTEMSTRNISQG
jgi:hypothetical protein